MRYITMPEIKADEIIQQMTEKLKAMFTESRNISAFTYNFKPEDFMGKADIILDFSAIAFLKQHMLVANHKDEIAWHGVVRTNENRDCFYIEDIMIYPQSVTGTTVTADEVIYQQWKDKLNDHQYNNLRYQAHSHVSMSTGPSGVDTNLYDSMLGALGPDSFYIFLITNKRGEFWVNIYDMPKNAIYEKSDIKITVEGLDLEEWYAANIKEYIKTYSWQDRQAAQANTAAQTNKAEDEKKTLTPTNSSIKNTVETRPAIINLQGRGSRDSGKFTYSAPYEITADCSAAEIDALFAKYEQQKKQGKVNYPMFCIGCNHCRTFNPKKHPCKTCEVYLDDNRRKNR